MIKIDLEIKYPGMSPQEEEDFREHIRQHLQPHLVSICCRFMRPSSLEGGSGDFVHSSKLDIDGTIKVQ